MMGKTENHRQIYPTLMASSDNRGNRWETEFRRLGSKTCSPTRRDDLRRALDLMRILEAYHSVDEERITLRQLALTRQGPGESIVGYINRWLELAYRCGDPPI